MVQAWMILPLWNCNVLPNQRICYFIYLLLISGLCDYWYEFDILINVEISSPNKISANTWTNAWLLVYSFILLEQKFSSRFEKPVQGNLFCSAQLFFFLLQHCTIDIWCCGLVPCCWDVLLSNIGKIIIQD